MNTCMQCLLSIPEFNHYFVNKTYTKEKTSNKKNTSCEALKEFIDCYMNSTYSIKPTSGMYDICHSFLAPREQHDCQVFLFSPIIYLNLSQEFLRRLLAKIQEELNGIKKYTIPDQCYFLKAWKIYKDHNPTMIDTIFSGMLRSSVICQKCNYQSSKIFGFNGYFYYLDTHDPFMDISLPIKRKLKLSLEQCLDNFFEPEFIDCDYKCSKCKKLTSVCT